MSYNKARQLSERLLGPGGRGPRADGCGVLQGACAVGKGRGRRRSAFTVKKSCGLCPGLWCSLTLCRSHPHGLCGRDRRLPPGRCIRRKIPQPVEGQQSISECRETHCWDELLDQDDLQVSLGDTLEAILSRKHREEGIVETGPVGLCRGCDWSCPHVHPAPDPHLVYFIASPALLSLTATRTWAIFPAWQTHARLRGW